jgi:hypothetical protein
MPFDAGDAWTAARCAGTFRDSLHFVLKPGYNVFSAFGNTARIGDAPDIGPHIGQRIRFERD